MIYSLSGATVDGFDNDNRSLNNVKLNVGTTTITWKATDVNGNVSTCTTQVTVSSSLVASPELSKVAPDQAPAAFTVRVMPNPSPNYFTLDFKSVNT